MRFDRWRYTLPLRLRSWLRRPRVERELDEELRYHLEQQSRMNLEKGMSPDEARRSALRAFGGVEQHKEECRDRRRLGLVEDLIQDARYAVRTLRRSPGFTAVAVLTLALGIGANIAIFQVLDAVVLRSLPVAEPDRLVVVKNFQDGDQLSFGYPLFREMNARQNVLEGMFASADFPVRDFWVEGGSFPATQARLASGAYFQVLGVEARIGRLLAELDDRPDAAPVAVVSDPFWRRAFGGRPDVVGRTVQVNGVSATIVGVTPRGFFGEVAGAAPDVWVPMSLTPQVWEDWLDNRGVTWFVPMGRLRPGVSREQAESALSTLYADLKEFGIQLAGVTEFRIELHPGHQGRGDAATQLSSPLWILMAMAGLIVLIACCNLANLLLARAAARAHEVGVRLAIGASRIRLIRQWMVESLLLAALGSLSGLAIAAWGAHELAALLSAGQFHFEIDWRVTGFTVALSTATAILFGVAPALAATKLDLSARLQATARATARRPSRNWPARTLIVAQVAISLALVVGASLLLRSFWNLQHQNFGYSPAQVVMVEFPFDIFTIRMLSANPELTESLQQRLGAIPGVASTALVSAGPLGAIRRPGRIAAPGREGGEAPYVMVSPGYFETMGIALIAGRPIVEADRGDARVAVISETAARSLFGLADPVGRYFSMGDAFNPDEALQVVGVAHDVRFSGPRDEFGLVVYAPLQTPPILPAVVVRAAADAEALAGPIHQALIEVEPRLQLSRTQTLNQVLASKMPQERTLALLSAVFGLLSLTLAAVGLYGVVAYGVARRTNEIGLRFALGATRSDVVGMVLKESLGMVGIGLALGLPLTLAASHVIRAHLFEITPTDPWTMALAVLVMVATATLAAFLPARRASAIDPMSALRQE